MRVAPFMEQDNVYNLADLRAWPWWQWQANDETINSIIVESYVCPSESRGKSVWESNPGSQGRSNPKAACTSYLGVSGRDSYKDTGGQDGMIFVNSKVNMGQVTDGTSNTLLLGERTAAANLLYGWQWAGAGDNIQGETDVVLGVHERIAVDWGADPNNYETDFFRRGTDNDPQNLHRFHFFSSHPGGGNWAMADGSTHFLSYDLDRGLNGSNGNPETILGKLSTRNGGETGIELR